MMGSDNLKNILIINASPRGSKSISHYFMKELLKLIHEKELNIETKNLKAILDFEKEIFIKKMIEKDAIILIFPLYYDSIPGMLLNFIWEVEEFVEKENLKTKSNFYTIVHCGDFHSEHTKSAINLMKKFSKKMNFEFRLAIGIGASEFIKDTHKNIPMNGKCKIKIYKSLQKIKVDLLSDKNLPMQEIYVEPVVTRRRFVVWEIAHFFKSIIKRN